MTQYTLSLTILGKDKVSGLFDRIDRGLRSIMNTALGVTLARVFEDIGEALSRMAASAINAVSVKSNCASLYCSMMTCIRIMSGSVSSQISKAVRVVANICTARL